VVAADGGLMQIQLWEGVSLRCAETVLSGATHDTASPQSGLGEKSIARAVVEEGARNIFP
jgi:hypothetical protein